MAVRQYLPQSLTDFVTLGWVARSVWGAVNYVSENALRISIKNAASPLSVTVYPRESYGPPVPPTMAGQANGFNAWNLAAIALVIVALGYLAKNISSFLR